jgi:hypothetical protein
MIVGATNTLAQAPNEAEKWNTLRPVATMMPTGTNDDNFRKKAKSRVDGTVSSADRNLSKVPKGALMSQMCATLNFSNVVAGGVIGLMQQMALSSVEVNWTKRELMTWIGVNISNMFEWALHPRCLKGNFTRAHRVCLARALADHTVDQVLESFSRHKEFNKAFDECTFALEMNSIEPVGIVKLSHTALRQTVDLPFFTITQAIVHDLKVCPQDPTHLPQNTRPEPLFDLGMSGRLLP